MKKVCIIGCGYIGSEVAALWSGQGYQVTATTRHPDRLDQLSKISQKGLIFKGTDSAELSPLIDENELLLITIAPDSPDQYANTYLQVAHLLRQIALEMKKPLKLIYTSSTTVYGDHQGLWVDETSPLLGNSEQAKILIETEAVYRSLAEIGWDVCILRLAEIYGPKRELSKRVRQAMDQKMKGLGNLYTNMVHRDDIVHAIDYAMKHNFNETYNLSDDDHPTRKELYDQVADFHHLPRVEWDPTQQAFRSDNKRVSTQKIKRAGYSFTYPHRVLD